MTDKHDRGLASVEPKTKLFSFYMFIDLMELAKKLATKERRSTASVINQALAEFFEKPRF